MLPAHLQCDHPGIFSNELVVSGGDLPCSVSAAYDGLGNINDETVLSLMTESQILIRDQLPTFLIQHVVFIRSHVHRLCSEEAGSSQSA